MEERSRKTYHLGLRNSSRETVQNETLLASRAVDVVLDDVDHDIVAHESSGVHGLLSTQTVLRSYHSNEHPFPTSGNSVAEHIASSEMANAILLLDLGSLSSLSATGRSCK